MKTAYLAAIDKTLIVKHKMLPHPPLVPRLDLSHVSSEYWQLIIILFTKLEHNNNLMFLFNICTTGDLRMNSVKTIVIHLHIMIYGEFKKNKCVLKHYC